jgi:hypothetical protein
MTTFWDAAPCSFVGADRRLIALIMMDAVRTSEMSMYFHETTLYYTPETAIFMTGLVRSLICRFLYAWFSAN